MKLPQLIYRKIFKFILLILLEVIAIVLITNNSIVQGFKIMEGVRITNNFFWSISNSIKNYTNLREVNRALTEENKVLLEQNKIYHDYITKQRSEAKLEELSNIISKNLGDSAIANFDFLLAKVIKNTRNTLHNYLIIDKGSNQGVVEDLGVITPSGVVGIIRAVGKNHSYVYSLLNTKQSISAKIGNSTVYGSLKWEGTDIDKAHLAEIPLNVEVKEGDIVYTSGNSSFFPPDIPIGVAGKYDVSSGMTKYIEVSLFQDFRNLEYVIIVKNNERREIDSLSVITPIINKR